MTPIMRQILTTVPKLPIRGLVGLYKFNEPAGSQVLYDYSGNGYDGQNGSTAGADTNDVTFDGVKATFGLDDAIINSNAVFDNMPQASYIVAFNTSTGAAGRLITKGASVRTFYLNSLKPTLILEREGSGITTWVNTSNVTANSNNIVFCGMDFTTPDTAPVMYNNREKVGAYIQTTSTGAVKDDSGAGLYFGNRSTFDRSITGSLYYILIYNIILSDTEYVQAYKALKYTLARRGVMLP